MFTLSIHTSAISKVSKELAIGILSTAIFSSSALADYIPASLLAAIPAGHVLYKKLHVIDGYGTQNYVCVQKADGTFAWDFYGPQATLSKNGSQAITHFLSINTDLGSLDKGKLQASWQDSNDSSKVWAAAIASVKPVDDALILEKKAIAWLTLKVTGSLTGPTGGRNLLKTTYIQRINTVGGVTPDPNAPESLCNAEQIAKNDANNLGTRFLVPYQTDYLFYKLAK